MHASGIKIYITFMIRRIVDSLGLTLGLKVFISICGLRFLSPSIDNRVKLRIVTVGAIAEGMEFIGVPLRWLYAE